MKEQINSLISRAAKNHGVRPEDLMGDNKRQPISAARQEAMYIIRREFPHLSYESIAMTFNRTNHATVLYAIQQHKKRSAKIMTAAHLGLELV